VSQPVAPTTSSKTCTTANGGKQGVNRTPGLVLVAAPGHLSASSGQTPHQEQATQKQPGSKLQISQDHTAPRFSTHVEEQQGVAQGDGNCWFQRPLSELQQVQRLHAPTPAEFEAAQVRGTVIIVS
jgi:hypothetical protein